jgi:hypothetical protein
MSTLHGSQNDSRAIIVTVSAQTLCSEAKGMVLLGFQRHWSEDANLVPGAGDFW